MHDVVIAGAGPVGLFLACELGLAGRSVLVLEREAEPGSPWRAGPLGARGLSIASVEALHRRELLDPLLKAMGAEDPGAVNRVPMHGVGHFAGIVLDPELVDPAALRFRLPGRANGPMMVTLEALEAVLAERAVQLGVEIRRDAEVSAVTQDEHGVVVRAGERDHPARWAVGCDGGRSAVRGLAGFEFTGTEPRFTGYTMLATVADPEKLATGLFHATPTGMYLRMSANGHLAMADFDGGAFDRSKPPTREHLQAVLRHVSGTDVTLTDVQLASTFTDRAMQATTYRRGRVLLAGDAAHIHSPLGGQGLNTGLGDALNLGWKLAATVRGHAPDGLLDSYTAERHPVGAWVLDWTRAQSVSMMPDGHGRAVRGVMSELLGTRDGTTRVFERVSGTGLRYDLDSDQPLVGRDAPNFHLADGTRLDDLMWDARGVALDFTPGGSLRATATPWEDRIRYVSGTARDDLGFGAVLVRPDGTVAWAGDPDPVAFDRAAARWFGAPDGTEEHA